MSLLVVTADIGPGIPYPQITLQNYARERGVFLLGGPPLAGRLPENIYFQAEDGETPGLADFMSGIGFVLVSQRLRDVWTASGADVEYLDAKLRYRQTIQPGYFLANPRHSFQGIDLGRSAVEMTRVGVAMTVDRLVLREEIFGDLPLAVLFEISKIVVQPRLAAAVVAGSCTGCRFVTPDAIRI